MCERARFAEKIGAKRREFSELCLLRLSNSVARTPPDQLYSMRVMVEKETSTPAALKPNDARQAFENLFKK